MKAGSLQEVQEISCLCVEINFAKNKSKKCLQFFKLTFLRKVCFRTLKVWTFWKRHKIWKNLPLKIWRYWVTLNWKWKIFSNFVPFSERPNFNKKNFSVWCFFVILLKTLTNHKNIRLILNKQWIWNKVEV